MALCFTSVTFSRPEYEIDQKYHNKTSIENYRILLFGRVLKVFSRERSLQKVKGKAREENANKEILRKR